MFNMNTNHIEILKLGSIVTTKQANGLRRLNIVCDGGTTFDYYRNLIIKNTSDIFEFYDTSKIFVCGPIPYNNHQRLIGISDSPLFVLSKLGTFAASADFVCVMSSMHNEPRLTDVLISSAPAPALISRLPF